MIPLEPQQLGLDRSVLPVWVYDHDSARFLWANEAALRLWDAASQEELLLRDLSNLFPVIRARLDHWMAELGRTGRIEEDWTLYPQGRPTTMTVHGALVQLGDGRSAMLCQAIPKDRGVDASMERGIEVLRHTSMMISLVDAEGRAVFHNPAALRDFGHRGAVTDWFMDREAGQGVLDVLRTQTPLSAEVRVQHDSDPEPDDNHWHLVAAQPTTDPVSGERMVLVQQHDVSSRRQAEAQAAARQRLIEELNQTLALVEQQRQEILSLSAPLIDVAAGTIALPLIGNLDLERSTEIAGRLLSAIVERRTRFVLMDLTGVTSLDNAGAQGLLRLVRAVQLLGAQPVLTGIRPQLAQGLLTTELPTAQLRVMRSLREGLLHCMSAPQITAR